MHKIRNWFYLLLSLLLLVLGTTGMVRQIGVGKLPADISSATFNWPMTVAGARVANTDELDFLVEGIPPGDTIILDSTSGPLPATIISAYSQSYLIIAGLSGMFFWLVACIVFVPRLDIPAVSQFYWITMLYGLGILLGGVFFQSGLAPVGMLLNVVQLTSLAFLPAVFLHLALIFPRRILSSQVTFRITAALYGMAILLVAWQTLAFGRYFHLPNLAHASGLNLPQQVADLSMVGQAVTAMIIMLHHARALEPGRQRQQVRWLLLGFFVGASPYLFFRTVPLLLSMEPPFPAQIDRIFEPAIPLAFVFSIIRYRFLDIDIILRRGILYGILAAAMLGLVLGPTALMQPERTIHWPRSLQTIPVLIGIFAGILFLPLRRILGRWIDHTFFRIEHRMDQIFQELQQQLKAVSSQEEVAKLLSIRIKDVINAEPCLVIIKPGSEAFRFGSTDAAPAATYASCTHAPGGLWILPNHSTCPDQEDSRFPQELRGDSFVIGLPLEAENSPAGCILMGRKHYGRRYVLAELKFLADVATAASARLQEIRLVQKMLEEKIKWTQLDELNSLKDNFLSQVAHDLRTPVTSVGWSIHNLLDGLAGEIQPRQREYLESMENSLEHLGDLVSSLLEISRLEKTDVKILTGPCGLQEILTRTADTIRPLAEAASVHLQCPPVGEKLQLITNVPKLIGVLVNILENGIRYSSAGAALEISAGKSGNKIILTVRDHGPGFQGIKDPFARFAQGQPSPHSKTGGYGLGLTIAREYTVLMGGEISARNHPGGGAEFTLVLPGISMAEEGA